MPDDGAPAIRPLPGGAPAPRQPGWGTWLAVVAGGVGVVVGLLVGIEIATDPEPATTTGDTLSAQPIDLAGPGFVDPATTTTLPPPTTTTSTLADPEPPPTLAEMAPGLDGTLLVAVLGDGQGVLRWRLDDPEPDRFPLPPAAGWAAFDAHGEWAAALTFPDAPLRPGAGLYLAGPDLHFAHFESGVASAAWHPTARGRLAWTRSTLEGSLELWTGDFPGPLDGLRRVTVLGPVGSQAPLFLEAWGDWGFALTALAPDGTPQLVTLAPDGTRRGESDARLVAATSDGTLLLASERGRGTVLPGLRITDPALEAMEPVAWAVTDPAVWAAGGADIASVLTTGVGAVLQVSGASTFQSVLDTPFAEVLAWSPQDRFVVMWAAATRTRFSADPAPRSAREERRPALVFVDLADRSTSAIALAGTPVDIAFRTAS